MVQWAVHQLFHVSSDDCHLVIQQPTKWERSLANAALKFDVQLLEINGIPSGVVSEKVIDEAVEHIENIVKGKVILVKKQEDLQKKYGI